MVSVEDRAFANCWAIPIPFPLAISLPICSASIERQIESVPRDTTHLIVSAGGSDALQYVGVF